MKPYKLLAVLVVMVSIWGGSGNAAADNIVWQTSMETAISTAKSQGKRILLLAGRETCGNCQYMKYTACESASPSIRSVIEQSFIPWFCDVDNSTQWYPYASGLGSFSLPLICVIDPNDADAFLDQTTGVQDLQTFYSRLLKYSATEWVQKAYIAYYGRPGDPAGVAYWANRLNDSGGALSSIIEAFGSSQEFTDNYGLLSNDQLIDTIYRQMFNRDPDPAGKQWYLEQLTSGAMTLQSITLEILGGAQNEDLSFIQNKLAVAAYFTDLLESFCVNYKSISEAKELMSLVDETAASVENAKSRANLLIQNWNVPPTITSGPSASTQKIATFIRQAVSVEAIDADCPNPLLYSWSKVSGPGTATFTNQNSEQTEVSFDKEGDYVLKVDCFDGLSTTTANVSIKVYGPDTDWRVSAFSKSQINYVPPVTYENIPELALPPSGREADPGLTFNEYERLGVYKAYDDHTFYCILGPCGNSHQKAVQFGFEGDTEPEPYIDEFNWEAPTPPVPLEKRPSHYGLAMIGHKFGATSSFPVFLSIDYYGIRVIPLDNTANFGTTFRITGYKAAQNGETIPQISKADFTKLSADDFVLTLEITHPNFEAAVCLLIEVKSNVPNISEIGLAIYPRLPIAEGELALWTFSSMNWKDTDPNAYAADCDTAVFGSEAAPNSTPIDNPLSGSTNLQIGPIELAGLKIVNGRIPAPESPYASAKYWTRPDSIVKVYGDKNKLTWDLTIFSTNYEGDDNVVLTGRNVSMLTPINNVDDGYVFLSQMQSESPH